MLFIYYRWNLENLFGVIVEKGYGLVFLEVGLLFFEMEVVVFVVDDVSVFVRCGMCFEDVLIIIVI